MEGSIGEHFGHALAWIGNAVNCRCQSVLYHPCRRQRQICSAIVRTDMGITIAAAAWPD
jgi:hypothetical protein